MINFPGNTLILPNTLLAKADNRSTYVISNLLTNLLEDYPEDYLKSKMVHYHEDKYTNLRDFSRDTELSYPEVLGLLLTGNLTLTVETGQPTVFIVDPIDYCYLLAFFWLYHVKTLSNKDLYNYYLLSYHYISKSSTSYTNQEHLLKDTKDLQYNKLLFSEVEDIFNSIRKYLDDNRSKLDIEHSEETSLVTLNKEEFKQGLEYIATIVFNKSILAEISTLLIYNHFQIVSTNPDYLTDKQLEIYQSLREDTPYYTLDRDELINLYNKTLEVQGIKPYSKDDPELEYYIPKKENIVEMLLKGLDNVDRQGMRLLSAIRMCTNINPWILYKEIKDKSI